MRKTLFVFALLLSGCSHAYIASSNGDQVTACCPTQKLACGDGALTDLAKDKCGGNATLVGEGTHQTGGVLVQRNMFNGDVLGISNEQEKCMAFKCDARDPASTLDK